MISTEHSHRPVERQGASTQAKPLPAGKLSAVSVVHSRTWSETPTAVLLESAAVQSIHDALGRDAYAFAGPLVPKKWTSILRCELGGDLLLHLCRLIVNKRPEAKLAATNAVRVLAHGLGYRLTPIKGVDLREALRVISEACERGGVDPVFSERKR